MTTIQEIKKAVTNLDKEKLIIFKKWFEKFDAKVWDEQLSEDIKCGRLDQLANNAISEYKKGNCKKL